MWNGSCRDMVKLFREQKKYGKILQKLSSSILHTYKQEDQAEDGGQKIDRTRKAEISS